MNKINADQLTGILRAVLSAVGGYFVGIGIVDASTMTTIVGGIVTVAVSIWSVHNNRTGEVSGVPEVTVLPATEHQEAKIAPKTTE